MSSAVDIASVVSQLTTNDQARSALGIMATMLSNGYTIAQSQITTSQGLQAQALSYLNQINGDAQQLYAKIPDDTADMSIINSGSLGIVASETNDVLANIQEAAHVSDFDLATALKRAVREVNTDVTDAASAIGNAAGNVAAAPLNGIVSGLAAFAHSARVALLIGGVVVVVYVFRRPLLAALGKVGA